MRKKLEEFVLKSLISCPNEWKFSDCRIQNDRLQLTVWVPAHTNMIRVTDNGLGELYPWGMLFTSRWQRKMRKIHEEHKQSLKNAKIQEALSKPICAV